MSNLMFRIVSSQNLYGTMNTGTMKLTNITNSDKEFIMAKHNLVSLDGYELTSDDKRELLINHRKAFADAKNFDWRKMYMADQNHKRGTYFEITKDYVEAYPNGWSDIPEDILIVSDKVPEVVIGHPVADCPVVMMQDMKKGVTAIGHCSAELIDKKLPMMIADALTESYGSKEEDISVWVSACAGPEWEYDTYPKWATDKKMWENAIVEKDGIFKIDMRKVLKQQFIDRKLTGENQVIFNLESTIKNPRYYSNSEARNNPDKFGRHFEGAMWQSHDDFVQRRKR